MIFFYPLKPFIEFLVIESFLYMQVQFFFFLSKFILQHHLVQHNSHRFPCSPTLAPLPLPPPIWSCRRQELWSMRLDLGVCMITSSHQFLNPKLWCVLIQVFEIGLSELDSLSRPPSLLCDAQKQISFRQDLHVHCHPDWPSESGIWIACVVKDDCILRISFSFPLFGRSWEL